MAFRKLLLAFLLITSIARAQVSPVGIQRGQPSVLPMDANLKVNNAFSIPVVPDTTTALSYGWDSLGMIIQIRNTGVWYKRDTMPGGHYWNALVSGGGGSDSGFQVLQASLTGVPVAKYVDGSGHRFVLYDTTGTHPGAMGTNAGIQKKIDSLSAVISGLLASKFGLTDTGYTHTLASVFTLGKVRDSLAAVFTAGLGTKYGAADTGYTHTLASIFILGKVRDSLAALIITQADSGIKYTTPTQLAAGLAPKVSYSDSTTKYVTPTQQAAALAGKEPTIASANTAGKYWNGYKLFVPLNADSIPAGATNKYFTTGDTAGLSAKQVNFGGAPGQLQGTYAGIPAATGYATGTTYIAQDSGFQYVDTGSGGSRGWKKISGGGSGGSLTPNSVTNAYLAQMAPNTIKGNNTGSTANAADLTTSQVITMLNAITNFNGVAFLGYGPYASHPTSGTGMYFASDSALTGGWFYVNGGSITNINPSTSITVRGLGQPGDSTLFSISGSALAGYTFHVATQRDSAGACIHHKVNSDGSWTWYSTCVVNAGGVGSLQVGTYAGRPSAASCDSCLYWSSDSVWLSYSNGSAWHDLKPGSGGGGGALSAIPNQTYLANISGAPAQPVALNMPYYNAIDYAGIAGDSTTDCTAGLNNLIDTVEKYKGGTIILPPGKFIISGTVTIPGPYSVSVIGSGFSRDNVIALPSVSDSGYGPTTIFYNQPSGVAIDNKANGSQFFNFCVANATSTATTTNTGIVMDSATFAVIEHVQLNNFNTLLDSREGVFFNYGMNVFKNAHTYGVKVASYAGLDAGDSRLYLNDFLVTSNLAALDTLLYYPNSGGLQVFANKFAGGSIPIYCPWLGFTDIDIYHNSIENYTGAYGILIKMATASSSLANLQIVNNQFYNGRPGENIHVDANIAGSYIFNGIVDDNIFFGPSAATDTALVVAGTVTGSFKVGSNNLYHNATPIYSTAAGVSAMTFPAFVSVPLASRMKLDMSLGNVFFIPALTGNDTIDVINGGAGNPFVIEVIQGASTAFNLISGNVTNQAQIFTTITLNPSLSSVNYIYGYSNGVTGGGTITGISRNFTNGSVAFIKGGSLADDNSNFFWDDVNDRLGIKNTVPVGTLHVADNRTSWGGITSGIVSEENTATADPARVTLYKSRGTYSAKTICAAGDGVGYYNFSAYNGAGYLQVAGIGSKLTASPTSTAVPTKVFVYTSAGGMSNPLDAYGDTGRVRQIWMPNGQIIFGKQGSPLADTLPVSTYDETHWGNVIVQGDSVATPNIPYAASLLDTTHYKLKVMDTRNGLEYYGNWGAFGSGGSESGGLYLPVGANVSSVSSITPDSSIWHSDGVVVWVDGSASFTPSSATINNVFTLSIPVNATLSSGHALWGTCATIQTSNGFLAGVISSSSAGSNNCVVTIPATGGTIPVTVHYHFSYKIE